MNKNRIRPKSTNLDVQSFIRRCEIAYDKRARYVEFVCSIWNEGRFGPDLADPVIIDWKDRPDLAPVSFLDLHDSEQNGPNCLQPAISPPSALNSSLGRAADQKTGSAFQTAKQTELSAATANGNTTDTSSNQGRGSP